MRLTRRPSDFVVCAVPAVDCFAGRPRSAKMTRLPVPCYSHPVDRRATRVGNAQRLALRLRWQRLAEDFPTARLACIFRGSPRYS